MGRIFVSHAVADKPLVGPFVDLLQIGLNLNQREIFCSSIEGHRIPSGKRFVEYIKDELNDSDVVIMLITQQYYESAFCLCELGATWVLAKDAIPLLVPPLNFGDLEAVLHGVQVASIDDKFRLNELRDRIEAAAIATDVDSGKWEMKRDEFLIRLRSILKKLRGRDTYSLTEYKALEEKYSAAEEQLVTYAEQNAELKDRIEKISKLKDRVEVQAVNAHWDGEEKQFEHHVASVKDSLKPLSEVCMKAIYHQFARNEYDVDQDHYHNQSEMNRAEEDARNGYIKYDGGVVTADESHPKMRKAITATKELSNWLDKASPEFAGRFEDENEIKFALSSWEFWREILNPKRF